MKKIIIAVLLIVCLTCSCTPQKGNNTADEGDKAGKYDFADKNTDSQSDEDSKDIRGSVLLLNEKRMPLKYNKTVEYSSKDYKYYLSLGNKNSEAVNCTVFVYFKKRLIPISVDGGAENDWYITSMQENEQKILPININLDGVVGSDSQTAYICAVFTATRDLEKLNAENIVFGYSTMTMDMLNFKSKSAPRKQSAESDQFTDDGTEAECINGGELSQKGLYYGLSFGEKILPDKKFECTSYLKTSQNDTIYLRCQAALNRGDTTGLILVDGKPVKAFGKKYFAAFNQGKQNAFSFPIDKGVIPAGQHLCCAVEFYNDETKYEDPVEKDLRSVSDAGCTLIDVE